jgi:hypothetical protein
VVEQRTCNAQVVSSILTGGSGMNPEGSQYVQ